MLSLTPVRKITGISFVRSDFFNFSITSKPFMPDITTSNTIMSGTDFSAISNAVSPSIAA
jgi:hypothetical protein